MSEKVCGKKLKKIRGYLLSTCSSGLSKKLLCQARLRDLIATGRTAGGLLLAPGRHFQIQTKWSSFRRVARRAKDQETTPNKELLKELERFSLRKNRLSRQENYLQTSICSCGKKDEVLPDGSMERIHTKAKKLISANAQNCPETNALLKPSRTLWGPPGYKRLSMSQFLICRGKASASYLL